MKRKIIILSVALLVVLAVIIEFQPIKRSLQVFNETTSDSATTTSASEQTAEPPDSTSEPVQTPDPEIKLVPYTGPIRHIFFHPLIVFPERAFDGDYMEKGYNNWFVTVKEFSLILESLYSKNYILIDINSLFDITTQDGQTTVKKKDLMLPEGKKPIVLSIDDLNYYEYMKEHGNAEKLVIDSDGNFKVLVRDSEGNLSLSNEEIVPLVDEFVEKHPDFSFNGAKGTIALTGYEGILGYRTHELDSPDYESEKKDALKIVSLLKEKGWNFASHSYGHLQYGTISQQKFERDVNRWRDEVEPLIGPTKILIYPFGNRVVEKENDPKLKYLMDAGFRVFCAVGPDGVIKYNGTFATLDRKSVDGLTLHSESKFKFVADLFDPKAIFDDIRPDNW
jgi:hypothetical protein